MTKLGPVAMLAAGCGTSLSTSQPAHVPAKGHVQGAVGVDISFSTNSISKVVNAADSFDNAARSRTLTDAEKFVIFEGGAHLAMNPPAAIPHLDVGYSPFDDWEVGARLAATGWRIGVRRQLLQQEDVGFDASVGIGVGSALFTPPIGSVFDTLRVTEFQRWTFDLPMAVGRRGSWYRWWAGPRLLYSTLSQTMMLSPPGEMEIEGTVDGSGFYVGGYAGVAFGYRSVFIGPEITLVNLFGSADVSAVDTTRAVDVDTFIVYPAFAVMGEF